MKNRYFSYIIVTVISLIIFAIINFFVFGFNSLDKKIINKKWYHYDYTTGYYDILQINKDSISYNSSTQENEYNNCHLYTFDKKKDIINLDCKKQIKIYKSTKNTLEIKVEEYDKVFFDNIDDSINYEFKNYYGKSIVDYKNEKSQVMEYSKINEERLLSILKEKNNTKIVFMGNNCTSVDCILALDIMEKWIIKSPNVYFFDSNDLNIELLSKMIKIIPDIPQNIDFYNGIYPRVLIVKSKEIINTYEVSCKGFNCSNLYKNEF